MSRKLRMFTAVLILLSLVLSGCSGSQKNSEGDSSPGLDDSVTSDNSEAATLFKQNCISCHGTNLKGRMGPKTNLTKVGARLNGEQIADKIHKGGNGMIAFKGKLSEEEINLLAEWLAALK